MIFNFLLMILVLIFCLVKMFNFLFIKNKNLIMIKRGTEVCWKYHCDRNDVAFFFMYSRYVIIPYLTSCNDKII